MNAPQHTEVTQSAPQTSADSPSCAEEATQADPSGMTELAEMLVETLDLEVAPEDIEADAPLFGDGLGLDSIDLLEIALLVSKRYGVRLTSEDRVAFQSLRSLATHIREHRTG